MVIWDNTTLFVDDSEEDRSFRAVVRDWVTVNYPQEFRHRTTRIAPVDMKIWHRRLFERGWVAPDWPREYGGMGATLTQQIILFEEIMRIGGEPPYPHGLSFIGPIIIHAGTVEQKTRFLPRILSGDDIWCQGYSEPEAGSDLANLKTRAELDGNEFIVNGHKVWTTNGHYADWMFALVRTDQAAVPRHAGISLLLIDLKSQGVTVRPIETIKGDTEFAEEIFENVRVPRANLLGPLNGGWRLGTALLGAERFITSNPGPTGQLLNHARRIAQSSGAYSDPDFCARLAHLEVDLLAFTAYYRQAAQLVAAGRAPSGMPPLIKIVGGELWVGASELLMQAAGVAGPLSTDVKIGDDIINVLGCALEARRMTVGSGTVEIQRNMIAKRVLGLPS
jgi:alkylation response protein AidB-like acyl-CoA dehydrogenase